MVIGTQPLSVTNVETSSLHLQQNGAQLVLLHLCLARNVEVCIPTQQD